MYLLPSHLQVFVVIVLLLHRFRRSVSVGHLCDYYAESSRKYSMQSRINSPITDSIGGECDLSTKRTDLSSSLTLETTNFSQENQEAHLDGNRRRFHSYTEGSAMDGWNESAGTCIHARKSNVHVNDTKFPPLTENNLAQSQVQQEPENTSGASNFLSTRVATTWKWTWGDLPIKFTDPSIADLHSLTTHMALREKNRGSLGDAAVNDTTNSSKVLIPTCTEISSSETGITPLSPLHPSCEYVQEGLRQESVSYINTCSSIRPVESLDDNVCIKQETTRKTCVNTGNNTFEFEVDSSDDVVSLVESDKGDVFPLLRRNTSTLTAVEVAAALTAEDRSTRILSLCGHILSGQADSPEMVPISADALQDVLERYSVSEDQFSRSPMEIVTNPNLVVVVNDLLIPWRLVHHALLTDMSISEGDDDSNEINNDKAVLWAGTNVKTWNNPVTWTEAGKNRDEDDYGQIESISDRSSTADNFTSISKEGELFYVDASGELLNGAYGNYFKSSTCEGDSIKLNMWSKESVDWNSSTDLTKMRFHMFRSFTVGSNDEFVPDLLRPYVDASKEKDSILKSNAAEFQEIESEDSKSSRKGSSHSMLEIPEAQHNSKSVVRTVLIGDTPSPLNPSSLHASRSHESALDSLLSPTSQIPHLHDLTGQSSDSAVTSIGEEQGTYGATCTALTVDATVSMTTNNTADNVSVSGGSGSISTSFRNSQNHVVGEKQPLLCSPFVSQEETDMLSLDNISPDEIRNDESDTESFYSLSIDDVESCSGNNAPETSEGGEKRGDHRKSRKYLYRKSLVPSQEQVQAMNLLNGRNEITFQVEGEDPVQAHIYVWPPDAKVIVADIEGALFVTKKGGKSLGKLAMSLWGGGGLLSLGSGSGAQKETHEGLAQLFNNIAGNGYHFLYIATSPDASSKDDLLKSQQSTGPSGLPLGPVFLPPDALVQTFGRERTDLYKAAALRGVRTLFAAGGQHNPYHAAFGAHEKDVRAFDRCGLPLGRTFLVSEIGEITTVTSATVKRTFPYMNAMLHEVFPSISDAFSREKAPAVAKSSSAAEDAYGDFNFWRVPPTLLHTP